MMSFVWVKIYLKADHALPALSYGNRYEVQSRQRNLFRLISIGNL